MAKERRVLMCKLVRQDIYICTLAECCGQNGLGQCRVCLVLELRLGTPVGFAASSTLEPQTLKGRRWVLIFESVTLPETDLDLNIAQGTNCPAASVT
jgi:hypothetical protein